jgi:hypothetical protein
LIFETLNDKLTVLEHVMIEKRSKWLLVNVRPLHIQETCERLRPLEEKLPNLFCIYPDRDQYHPLILKNLRKILMRYNDIHTVIIEQIPHDILRKMTFTELKRLAHDFPNVDIVILNNFSRSPLSSFKTQTQDKI